MEEKMNFADWGSQYVPQYPDEKLETNDLTSTGSAEPPERHRPHLSPQPAAILKSGAATQPSEDRHSRKCKICRHPERDQIEEDFLLWRRPKNIIQEFNVPEISLFRHAHAFKLFQTRRENLKLAIDRVIERGSQVENTGETIIKAVRAQACLTDDNRWVEPARTVIHINETVVRPPQTAARDGQFLIDSSTIRNTA